MVKEIKRYHSSKLYILISLITLLLVIIQVKTMVQGNIPATIDIKKTGNIASSFPSEILSEIEKNRTYAPISKENLISRFKETFLYEYNSNTTPTSYIECSYDENNYSFIDKKSAIADVEYLFSSLEYGYAGYKCFGGEKSFAAAKQEIIKGIEVFKADMPSSYLEGLIYKNLSFIQDGHFAVGQKSLVKRYRMYMSEKFEIEKESNTFYLMENGEKKLIVSIENTEPLNYIKPSINKNGNIIYRLCFLAQTDNAEMPIKVELSDGSITVNLSNISDNYKANHMKSIYSLKEMHGIPVIKVSSFVPSNELQNFEEDAKKMRDRNLLIIDLRGNSGGSSSYSTNWIKNFTGYDYKETYVSSSLCTEISIDALLFSVKRLYGNEYYKEYEDKLKKQYTPSLEYKNWSKVEYNPTEKIKNKIPIFILVDRYTASAGESFVDALKDLDNTFVVGTNSSGTGDIGNAAHYILPNSKIEVTFGSLLIINEDLELTDGLGIKPDFWINPKDAEMRVLKLISNFSNK